MSEVKSVRYSGQRETEKHVMKVEAVAAGFNADGTLVLDLIGEDHKQGIRIRISPEDVHSQRHVLADWARRREK